MSRRCIPLFLSPLRAMILILALAGAARIAMAAAGADHQLLNAVEAGDLAAVQTLLEKGADVNARARSGATPLMIAADQGNLDIVRLLLDKGADANAKDGQDSSALMEASKQGFLEIVKLLLEKGANVSATDNKGKTAAMYAGERGHPKVENVLKAHVSAPIVSSQPPRPSEDRSASSGGIIDLNLLHKWELLYRVDEKGNEERPKDGTRTLLEFTDQGQVVFSRLDNNNSDRMQNRAGRYAVDGNKISLTDDVGNTVKWLYQISGDTLAIDVPEVKNKFYWGRFR